MKYTLILILSIAIAGLAAAHFDTGTAAGSVPQPKPSDLVVHEWGTFTSIAGKNGVALDWRPLNGPSDLPTFVYSQVKGDGFRGTYGIHGKGDISRVRMETPVIYFYTKEAMDVTVQVDFPEGHITEWYPQASVVNSAYGRDRHGRFMNGSVSSGINWGIIKLLPEEQPNYMREAANSHYYPARETDAVPIQVCNFNKSRIEKEKFLFYRGTGNFELPLTVKLDGDRLILGTTESQYGPKGNPGHNINNAIVFENRGGRIGYRVVPSVSGDTPVERPRLDRNLGDIYAELERTLILQGLYAKEARAMIETWKDSWFEEGVRVFYILPRMATDKVLPLRVQPQPKETVRVLVGRSEVITPQMETDVRRQVNRLRSPSAAVRAAAEETLKQHGRFYEPVLASVLKTETNPFVRSQLEHLIRAGQND